MGRDVSRQFSLSTRPAEHRVDVPRLETRQDTGVLMLVLLFLDVLARLMVTT